jgi:hypothetical protein
LGLRSYECLSVESVFNVELLRSTALSFDKPRMIDF